MGRMYINETQATAVSAKPDAQRVPGRFQVLALDGGGVKALFTAHLLARLEEDLNLRIRDSFDLITGTSAGGIIALGLGAGVPPAEIAERYEQLASTVFPVRRRRWWRWPARLYAATYRQEPLRQALVGIFGEKRLGDSDKRLVIPAWDAQAGRVHVFKTRHHPRLNRDWKIPMLEVALATSAAPAYLPAAHVDGHRLIDGGVWANNPSAVAIAEAVSMLGAPLSSLRVLNVGTTDAIREHPRSLDNAGFARWAPCALDLVISASSRGAQGLAEHLVGADQYSRFDTRVPDGLFRLDRAITSELVGLAAGESRRLSPTFTSKFAGHVCDPFTPQVSRP